MEVINVFLDDVRTPYTDFRLARTYQECIYYLKNYIVDILSLDHDLGDDAPQQGYTSMSYTGYDVCKWMVENNVWANVICLHTANPVGRDNMFQLLERYKPEYVKLYRYGVKFG